MRGKIPFMVNGLVTFTELGLLALVGILAIRMVALSRGESLELAGGITGPELPGLAAKRVARTGKRVNIASSQGAELRTQLHILAGLQERDCRDRGLVLAEATEAVRVYAAAWLYGAGCALSRKPVRHSGALAGMVARIVSRKTGIRQPEAIHAISTLTSSSVLLACYRAGLEGAEHWRRHQYVPANSSLYDAATSNAFI
jgi:hypothetical protein